MLGLTRGDDSFILDSYFHLEPFDLLSFSLLMTGSAKEGEEAASFAWRALQEEVERGTPPRDRELFLLRAAARRAWELERERGGRPPSPEPLPQALLSRKGRRILSAHPGLPYAIASLPFEERAALLLHHLLRKDHPRTAEILGRDGETTLLLLSRARLRLLSLLGEPLPSPEGLPPACASLLPLLSLRSEGALPREQEDHLRTHLASCPACAHLASRLREKGRLLRDLPALALPPTLLGGAGGALLALQGGTPTGAVGAASAGAGIPTGAASATAGAGLSTGAVASASAGAASTSGGALAALGSMGLAGKIAVGLTTLALVGGVATGGYYGVRKLTGGSESAPEKLGAEKISEDMAEMVNEALPEQEGAPPPSEIGKPRKNGRLAFVRNGDIWVAEGDGEGVSGERQLTFTGNNSSPSFSPDGKEVVYLQGRAAIMAVSLEGASRPLLSKQEWDNYCRGEFGMSGADDQLGSPVLSTKDNCLYFTTMIMGGRGGASIARKNMANGRIEIVFSFCYGLSVSPRGEFLIWSREWVGQSYRTALYLHRSLEEELGIRIGNFHSSGTFSRDGGKIAASGEGVPEIYVYNLQGGLIRSYQTGGPISSGSISFTPDASHLAFSAEAGGGQVIYTLRLEDGQVRPLVQNGKDPSWSPVYFGG